MNKQKRSAKSRTKPGQRVIALLTDFGDRDHYVGTMKGVILSIHPGARIIDLSNNVTPRNVHEAGYLLWASYKYFPEHTVFVCVVDPGVGSDRRIVCLETGRHQFIAPDNGLLDFILLLEKAVGLYEIDNPPRFGTNPPSTTFHGRDIFAPLAAHLSMGRSVKVFGKRRALNKPSPVFCTPEAGVGIARILHVDRFGNLITNIPEEYFEPITLKVGNTRIAQHIRRYVEGPDAQPCLILGSSGLIEVVVKNGSAAKMLGVDAGTQITVVSGRK